MLVALGAEDEGNDGAPLRAHGLADQAHARLVRKSQNRWYVDADHQKEAALLFFPGVVTFAKGDVCRFCAADGACDGALPAWAGRPGNPPLRPFEP